MAKIKKNKLATLDQYSDLQASNREKVVKEVLEKRKAKLIKDILKRKVDKETLNFFILKENIITSLVDFQKFTKAYTFFEVFEDYRQFILSPFAVTLSNLGEMNEAITWIEDFAKDSSEIVEIYQIAKEKSPDAAKAVYKSCVYRKFSMEVFPSMANNQNKCFAGIILISMDIKEELLLDKDARENIDKSLKLIQTDYPSSYKTIVDSLIKWTPCLNKTGLESLLRLNEQNFRNENSSSGDFLRQVLQTRTVSNSLEVAAIIDFVGEEISQLDDNQQIDTLLKLLGYHCLSTGNYDFNTKYAKGSAEAAGRSIEECSSLLRKKQKEVKQFSNSIDLVTDAFIRRFNQDGTWREKIVAQFLLVTDQLDKIDVIMQNEYKRIQISRKNKIIEKRIFNDYFDEEPTTLIVPFGGGYPSLDENVSIDTDDSAADLYYFFQELNLSKQGFIVNISEETENMSLASNARLSRLVLHKPIENLDQLKMLVESSKRRPINKDRVHFRDVQIGDKKDLQLDLSMLTQFTFGGKSIKKLLTNVDLQANFKNLDYILHVFEYTDVPLPILLNLSISTNIYDIQKSLMLSNSYTADQILQIVEIAHIQTFRNSSEAHRILSESPIKGVMKLSQNKNVSVNSETFTRSGDISRLLGAALVLLLYKKNASKIHFSRLLDIAKYEDENLSELIKTSMSGDLTKRLFFKRNSDSDSAKTVKKNMDLFFSIV